MLKHFLIGSILLVSTLQVASACGDNFCDRKHGENHANCPEDCVLLVGIATSGAILQQIGQPLLVTIVSSEPLDNGVIGLIGGVEKPLLKVGEIVESGEVTYAMTLKPYEVGAGKMTATVQGSDGKELAKEEIDISFVVPDDRSLRINAPRTLKIGDSVYLLVSGTDLGDFEAFGWASDAAAEDVLFIRNGVEQMFGNRTVLTKFISAGEFRIFACTSGKKCGSASVTVTQ